MYLNPFSPMSDTDQLASIHQKLEELAERQNAILSRSALPPSNGPSKKDGWDKLAAIGPIVVSIAVAVFTYLYQMNEGKQRTEFQQAERFDRRAVEANSRRMQELQLMATFLPTLTGHDEPQKALAIELISKLGSPELAGMLASAHPSPGAAIGLRNVRASNLSTAQREAVNTSFRQLPAPLQQIVGPLRLPSPTTPIVPDFTRERVELNRSLSTAPESCRLWLDERGQPWCGGSCPSTANCGRIALADSASALSNSRDSRGRKLYATWRSEDGSWWVGGPCQSGMLCASIEVTEQTPRSAR